MRTPTLQNPDRYSDTIINNTPTVVERSSGRIVPVW